MPNPLQSTGNNTGSGTGTTVTATFGSNISAGSTVLGFIVFESETNTPTVADGAGNVYSIDTLFTNATDHRGIGFIRKSYITAPGTNTVTLTMGTGVASKGLFIFEYPGLDATAGILTNWARQTSPGTGTGALLSPALSPATALPYQQIGVSMSITGSLNGTPISTSGFTNRGSGITLAGALSAQARVEDKVLNSTNAVQAPFTAGVGTDTYYTGQLLIAQTFVPNTLKTNPFGKTYGSITNAALFASKSGLIVTAKERNLAPFGTTYATVRAGGGEVLAYLDVAEIDDAPAAGDAAAFYSAGTYLWPYPTYGTRVQFINTHLADLRAGSAWADHVVTYVSGLIDENQVDGIYLDVFSGVLYDNALNTWSSWPATEKDAWTLGCIDLARRLDELRRIKNPNFLIVVNGVWDRGGGDTLAQPGEQYIDGVDIEHHPLDSYHIAYVNRTFGTHPTFGNLNHRRVLVTALSTSDAQIWALIQGVTHVDDQTSGQYSHPNVPVVGFNSLNDRNLVIVPPPVITPPPTTTTFTAPLQFSSYADFRNKLHIMLDGDDISTSDLSVAVLDLIIGAGENRIYRELRSSTQHAALTLTITGNLAPLPTDFLEIKGAPYIANKVVATYAPWEDVQNQIQLRSGARSSNSPVRYTFQGDNILFYPPQADGTIVSGQYFKQFSALTTGLNPLFVRHSDIFLYAALAESGLFLGEMTRQPGWEQKYLALMTAANEHERRRVTRGSKLQTRLA